MDVSKITWIMCDGCGKWRQVAQSLADALDEDAEWFCSMNPDERFNRCEAPQELTDQEIDKNMAKAAANGHTVGEKQLRPSVWQHVSENIFTHRGRKVEHEDEIMVCQCSRPRDGSMGCGENCLNRLLNQECNPEYCPCGELCSNTQFTKKQYSNIEHRRAGPKGFGLFTNQDLQAGDFIIEYVGEVLSEEEYMRRKHFYQLTGQRHYYFMNVGNGEVIDACRKGALGRFINHSCEPNCETQKWLVHGELAIGLFALKDVAAGSELTFDYNFERYGDKALKCYCNSKKCRGYIGGTPEENEVVQEEEAADASMDPEPIMVQEEDVLNPACQAILAEEVGLAAIDYQDSSLRKGYEELAAKYGVSLQFKEASKVASPEPADSAEESKTQNGLPLQPTSLEAVEEKLKTSEVVQRAQKLASSKSAATVERKHLAKKSSSLLSHHSPARPGSSDNNVQSALAAPSRPHKGSSGKDLRRRSEVDRRLESMVGASGKLKEMNTSNVVKMLRLFNLCDLGTASTESPAPKAEHSEASSRSIGATFSGPMLSHSAQYSDGSQEEGVEHHSKRLRTSLGDYSPRPRSPGRTGRVEQEAGRNEIEIRAAVSNTRSSVQAGNLSSRQRARMADLSLLLDVILKTSSTSNLRIFCQSGILRQLQSAIARCHGSAFSVIIKKMLRAVEHLPLAANDFHRHTSAHGSFSDTLWVLGKHLDYEIRTKARALREKFQLENCSSEIQEAAKSKAQTHRPQRSQFSSSPHPWHKYEGRGDYSGTPHNRGPGDKPQRGPTPRRWQGSADSGLEAPFSNERFGRNRERNDRKEQGPWQSSSLIHSHSVPHPSPRPGQMGPNDRRESESWRGLHRLHQSSNSTTPLHSQQQDWHLNVHPAHRPSQPSHKAFAQPDVLLSPAHGISGQTPPLPPNAGGAHQGQSHPSLSRLSIPECQPGLGMDNLSASNPAPMPSERERNNGLEDLLKPPLPTEPPPPLPTSQPASFPHSRPVSTGDSMQRPPEPPGQPPQITHPAPQRAGPSGSAYRPGSAKTDWKRPEANGIPSISAEFKAKGSESHKWPSWFRPGERMSDDQLKEALSAPLSLTMPATVMERDAHGGAKELPLAANPHQLGSQTLTPSSSLNPTPPSGKEFLANGGNLRPGGAELNGVGGQVQGVPTPQLPTPAQSSLLDDPAGSPHASDGLQSWAQPDSLFEEFVEKTIKHRLRKNQQPGNPNRISSEEVRTLFQKSRRAIIEAERVAFEERRQAQAFKAIDRGKVELRIKEYVRDLIRRLHDRKHGKIATKPGR